MQQEAETGVTRARAMSSAPSEGTRDTVMTDTRSPERRERSLRAAEAVGPQRPGGWNRKMKLEGHPASREGAARPPQWRPRGPPLQPGTEASDSASSPTAPRWGPGCWGPASAGLVLRVSAKLLKTLPAPGGKSICSFHIEEKLFRQ